MVGGSYFFKYPRRKEAIILLIPSSTLFQVMFCCFRPSSHLNHKSTFGNHIQSLEITSIHLHSLPTRKSNKLCSSNFNSIISIFSTSFTFLIAKIGIYGKNLRFSPHYICHLCSCIKNLGLYIVNLFICLCSFFYKILILLEEKRNQLLGIWDSVFAFLLTKNEFFVTIDNFFII